MILFVVYLSFSYYTKTMKLLKHYYIIEAQFLGFRYFGWQKQSDFKTVQETIEKSLAQLLENDHFTIRGASRTDSMVSAEHFLIELKVKVEIPIDFLDQKFIEHLNILLPPDIKILTIRPKSSEFNIISSPKNKEYHYYFSFGKIKPHPFSAPLMTHINGQLDLELMKEGAMLFLGTHHFRQYCFRPKLKKDEQLIKTIECIEILKNDIYQANFFPEETFYLKIIGHGFARHQIRLIMGALFKLGLNQISLDEIKQSLTGLDYTQIGFIAPASGLVLHKIKID
jgi:tRNA pseudouridine38-40 synthase